MNTFSSILKASKTIESSKIAVACAHDHEVIEAIELARKDVGIEAILVGDQAKIEEIINENGYSSDYQIINETDDVQACAKAVELVTNQQAQMVMKGLVDTSKILKAVLNKEANLRTGRVLSHVAIFEVPNYDRLIFVSDAAMNIAPNVEQKIQIVDNSVAVAHALEINNPIVGVLAAVEKVNEAMPATTDAQQIVERHINGEMSGCQVGGPYALDNAISLKAAQLKGMTDEKAGKADILIVPNIESGNVLYKSLSYFANAENAGIIMGAKAPIILTSRADSAENKMRSIAVAKLVANNIHGGK